MKKMTDPYKTIEEVWQWRRKAYGEIEGLPEKERLRRVQAIGKKYANRLHLRRIEKEKVK
jgi:hypothetical protein